MESYRSIISHFIDDKSAIKYVLSAIYEMWRVILIAIGIALISALGWHTALKHYWLSCIGSAVTSAVLMWIVAQSHLGWPSIEMLYLGGLGFVVAALVGLLFRLKRAGR